MRWLGWSVRNKLHHSVSTTGRSDQPLVPADAAQPLHAQLQSLAQDLIAARATPDQAIGYVVKVTGQCPERLRDPLMRIAAELVDDALRHGMALLRQGRVEISLVTEPDGSIELAVRDNGWQPLCHAWTGEDAGSARALASAQRGTFALRRRDEWTEAVVRFPGKPTGQLGLTVLGYGMGLLSIVWYAVVAQGSARHGAQNMWEASVCIASVVLISGSECPTNIIPGVGMRSAEWRSVASHADTAPRSE